MDPLVAATDPSVLAAILAATGAIVAGVFSLRSRAGADLVDDVMADRQYLKDRDAEHRERIEELEGKVETLTVNQRATEEALLACRARETALQARIHVLEERRP